MANERTYIRFPAIDIEQNATINSALVRFTAYEYQAGNLSVDCYFENSANTTAPSSKSELTSLPLTGGTTWSINEAWVEGETYDTPEIGNILQVIISKDGWLSGNAVTFIMDIAGEMEYKKFCAEEYYFGIYKAQLIIESTSPTRVATPVISPITGSYIEQQTITITCATPGSSIYYTTDGSDPDETDLLYSDSFTLYDDTTVKAITYNNDPGYTASTIKTNTLEIDISPYGVEWDESNSSPILTRTGSLVGYATASSPGNVVLPVQALMKRCILSDTGVVQYYLHPTDSTLQEDGITPSNLDGTDGQVMVEIPKFAYKYDYNGTTHSWSIAFELLDGYEWHPAFYKDESWVDYRYMGAYEGVGYDNSNTAYFDGDYPLGITVDLANDKLGSVSGFAPLVNQTRNGFRSLTLNRGVGYRQQDFYLISSIQLLYLVEYASFYSQNVIGMGRTEITGGSWVKDSNIGVTGKSNSDGNSTDNVGGNTNNAYMSYRGIENFYGNIWKWVDGFNINNNIPYVSNTETHFADDTLSNYTRLTDTGGNGITLHSGWGWQTTLEQTKGGFLPSAVGGSSSTYITDFYWDAAGWRIPAMSGFYGTEVVNNHPGFFAWDIDGLSSDDFIDIGSRLCF